VLLPNGKVLEAEVKKFSAPISFDASGQATKDSGHDLALLRVQEGVYPALALNRRDTKIGDTVHILGFPDAVLYHELLNRSLDASVTSGAVSGFQRVVIGQDVIQTDASAAHGSSGGPAIGDEASVVGVMMFVSISQGFN